MLQILYDINLNADSSRLSKHTTLKRARQFDTSDDSQLASRHANIMREHW